MSVCPYCGSECFVSATTTSRDEGSFASGSVVGATWENECSACGKWSLHDDDTSTQLPLVDPDDKHSAVV